MQNSIKDNLAKDEYYHGTSDYKAIQILYEGFRLKKDCSDYGRYGTFKQGLYLTKTLDIAGLFARGYIFKCHVKSGTSILWLDGNYDQKVIQYLKREFSKSILDGDISKVIPRNKNLTKNELIHLLNYRFSKAASWARKHRHKWFNVVSSFRQQLQLHKYDGVGETKEEDGVAIFNPSLVKPVELLQATTVGEKTTLKPLNHKKFIKEITQHYIDLVKYYDYEDKEERSQVSSFMERYCQENGLT